MAAGRNRTAVYVRILDTPRYAQWNIKVHYSKLTGEWNVEGKSYDRSNLKAYNTYGTKRVNAYKIIEDTLNMKDVRVFDYMEDDEGKRKLSSIKGNRYCPVEAGAYQAGLSGLGMA